MDPLDRIAGLDRFFVQQRFALMLNQYTISTLEGDNQEGEPLAYVRQKRLKIRERIDFFEDQSQTRPLLRLQARKIFELRGRTEVQLPDGTIIGQLQKVFGASLFRSTWQLLDADENEVARAQESSMGMALLRRLWDFIPLASNIPFFIPFHFNISVDGKTVGRYQRIWAIRDRYVMDLRGDTERKIDRRVAMAFCVALDALQGR